MVTTRNVSQERSLHTKKPRKTLRRHLKKVLKKHLAGFSLHRDAAYIRNLAIIIGTLFMRWGGRELITQILPGIFGHYAPIVSLCIGVAILFTIDSSGYFMGYYEGDEDQEENEEVEKE